MSSRTEAASSLEMFLEFFLLVALGAILARGGAYLPVASVISFSVVYCAKAAVVFTGPVERRRGMFKSDMVGLEKFRDGVRFGERFGTAGAIRGPIWSVNLSQNVGEM